MVKSPDAFRTISEVADWLGIQAHVLRFWESKFTQVKPIKRAGGRRYYRPADMLLLGGIKKLLHDDGLTIKGVQKILREDGMTHVSSLSAPLDELGPADTDSTQARPTERETGVVLKFGSTASEPAEEPEARSATPDFEAEPPAQDATPTEAPQAKDPAPSETQAASALPDPAPMPSESAAPNEPREKTEPKPYSPIPPADDHPRATPDPLAPSDRTTEDAPRLDAAEASSEPDEPSEPADAETTAQGSLPGFLQRPLGETMEDTVSEPEPVVEDQSATASEPQAEPADDNLSDDTPKPAIIDLPDFTPEADFPAYPGLLTRIARVQRLPREVQPEVAGLLLQLADLRGRMDANSGVKSNF